MAMVGKAMVWRLRLRTSAVLKWNMGILKLKRSISQLKGQKGVDHPTPHKWKKA